MIRLSRAVSELQTDGPNKMSRHLCSKSTSVSTQRGNCTWIFLVYIHRSRCPVQPLKDNLRIVERLVFWRNSPAQARFPYRKYLNSASSSQGKALCERSRRQESARNKHPA
ncbi:hypothetical protein BaRGS_00022450 [Batillaria attramentaria]|uniref:Uncharacterized protein n=1 Tax=Batillaria attramentaria TaxID=370345 RepID=A0ABD0KH39_9CAEN